MADVPQHTPNGAPSPQEGGARKHVRESERLEALRERLYARGVEERAFRAPRHELVRETPVPPQGAPVRSPAAPPLAHTPTAPASATPATPVTPVATTPPRHGSLRKVLLVLGVLFFVVALGIASYFLSTGKNTISGSNISVDVAGPVAVGGGDAMNLQVTVANQNTLPIESATLIVDYPRGAQSVVDPGRSLQTERQSLGSIQPGEVLTVPLRMLMFGEENELKEVRVSVEYRIAGSNATFSKEALPYTVKMTTSPITVNVDAVERAASGQEVTLTLTVRSNAQEELTDLLLKTEYPREFSYVSAKPDPTSGQDTWAVDSLKPGSETTITITGRIDGQVGDKAFFAMKAGVADARDPFTLASTLAVNNATIELEQPFLDVAVRVNSDDVEVVTVNPHSYASLEIGVTNTLDVPVYDVRAEVTLAGNALDEQSIQVHGGGNYDSTTNRATWDAQGTVQFTEILPGEREVVTVSLKPNAAVTKNPEITAEVTVRANRMLERQVSDEMKSVVTRTLRLPTDVTFDAAAIYSDGPFTNNGSLPPVAEERTTYSLLLTMKNGANDIAEGTVEAYLPAYVEWLGKTSDSSVTYAQDDRRISWKVGAVPARAYREVWVQVGFTPSLSQVGSLPILLETQRFRAKDTFTNEQIEREEQALTTHLIDDPLHGSTSGFVEAP